MGYTATEKSRALKFFNELYKWDDQISSRLPRQASRLPDEAVDLALVMMTQTAWADRTLVKIFEADPITRWAQAAGVNTDSYDLPDIPLDRYKEIRDGEYGKALKEHGKSLLKELAMRECTQLGKSASRMLIRRSGKPELIAILVQYSSGGVAAAREAPRSTLPEHMEYRSRVRVVTRQTSSRKVSGLRNDKPVVTGDGLIVFDVRHRAWRVGVTFRLPSSFEVKGGSRHVIRYPSVQVVCEQPATAPLTQGAGRDEWFTHYWIPGAEVPKNLPSFVISATLPYRERAAAWFGGRVEFVVDEGFRNELLGRWSLEFSGPMNATS